MKTKERILGEGKCPHCKHKLNVAEILEKKIIIYIETGEQTTLDE